MNGISSTRTRAMSRLLMAVAATSLVALPSNGIAAAKGKGKDQVTAPAKKSVRVNRAAVPPRMVGTQRTMNDVSLSVGRGQLINLSAPITDVFVSNDKVADVQVRSATQIYVYAKEAGESSVFATSPSGQVVYSATIRAGQNVSSIDTMLKMAMPDASIQSTPLNGMVLLTGTVAGPDDGAEAERLVQAYVGDTTKVVSRIRTATPLQVNLQVKIAEVSRAFAKEIGVNLLSRDATGGFQFGVSQGRNFGTIKSADISGLPKLDASTIFGLPTGTLQLPFDPKIGKFVTDGGTEYAFNALGLGAGKSSFGLAGRLLGIDLSTALDLAETDGLVTTLAQPNLTALSGETASFLAGGEIPVPTAATLGEVRIEYKPYGVSLAFTPTVLADGRISMRVRPEVSELSNEGAVKINGFDVPGITTRRAETTVELGSGQSFMIGGLLRSTTANAMQKAPGAGDLPILGALFRSNSFRRNDTELMIIVTPYLVKPVNASDIVLPTDGYLAPNDAERLLLGRTFEGKTGQKRPVPTSRPDSTVVRPSIGAAGSAPVSALPPVSSGKPGKAKRNDAAAKPGFSN